MILMILILPNPPYSYYCYSITRRDASSSSTFFQPKLPDYQNIRLVVQLASLAMQTKDIVHLSLPVSHVCNLVLVRIKPAREGEVG